MQIIVNRYASVLNLNLDLIFLILVYFAIKSDFYRCILVATVIGLVTDYISMNIFGVFGFSRTVTMGIVSSNRRELNINGIRYPDMIQTDTAINEGNDGGPLINIKGEVIGVNMACFMPDNQYSGIGFAIPINDILGFVSSRL